MTIDVVFRNEKGDELTWEEMDANLANLQVAIETKKDNFSILPVEQGGTGVATLAEAKQVLEVPEFANQIEYMPAGIGAVSSDVQSKLRERVSIKDFGAKGDGIQDDTSAIQAWLTYISTNKLFGYPSAGTYKITAKLVVGAYSNWGIVGDGSASVKFLYAGASTTTDIFVFGDGVGSLVGCTFSGFKLDSTTTMTGGVGIHFKKLCRSTVRDVIAAGQDGSGNLWHGVRFNGVDNCYYDEFEIRAQKDGLQVNGLVSGPKADLLLGNYKIGQCDVGIRFGGAYGGGTLGKGSVVVCGDGVVIDNTLVAEINREIFFSDATVIDANTRSNIVIDQSLSGALRVNIPGRMWCGSSGSHAIWIKNANGALIDINAYIYNIVGDGIRIDDANAIVNIDSLFASISTIGTYAINETVATTKVKFCTNCRFESVLNPFNYTNNRAVTNLPMPVSVQGGRAVYWETFSGTLNASGNALFAHGKGGTWSKKVIAIFASAKATGGQWNPLTPAYIDGTNISVTGNVGLANQPYNVNVLVGDEANVGW